MKTAGTIATRNFRFLCLLLLGLALGANNFHAYGQAPSFSDSFSDSFDSGTSNYGMQEGFNTEITPGASTFDNPFLLHTEISDQLFSTLSTSSISPIFSVEASPSFGVSSNNVLTDAQQSASLGYGAWRGNGQLSAFTGTTRVTQVANSGFSGAAVNGASFRGQSAVNAQGTGTSQLPAFSAPVGSSLAGNSAAAGDGIGTVQLVNAATGVDPTFKSGAGEFVTNGQDIANASSGDGSVDAELIRPSQAANTYFSTPQPDVSSTSDSIQGGIGRAPVPGTLMGISVQPSPAASGFPDSTRMQAGPTLEGSFSKSPLESAERPLAGSPFQSMADRYSTLPTYLNPNLRGRSRLRLPRQTSREKRQLPGMEPTSNDSDTALQEAKMRRLGQSRRARLSQEQGLDRGIQSDPMMTDSGRSRRANH